MPRKTKAKNKAGNAAAKPPKLMLKLPAQPQPIPPIPPILAIQFAVVSRRLVRLEQAGSYFYDIPTTKEYIHLFIAITRESKDACHRPNRARQLLEFNVASGE